MAEASLDIGRMLADGLQYRDLVEAAVLPREGWFDFWAARGEEYEHLGEEALAEGGQLTGGELLWLASLSFHYAQFMWFHDHETRAAGQRRKVELYQRAAPYLDPPAERVEIDFEGNRIPGYLRLPGGGSGPHPCTLVLGGLESTKEESYLFENMCLRRGLATFAFDGPGQGEFYFQVRLQPDFERYASAVLDMLETRPEIDQSRLGVIGRSLGGFYAMRTAAADDRVQACVAWGAFYDLSHYDELPERTRAGFSYVTGYEDPEEGRPHVQAALSLEGAAARLRMPLYVLHGRQDQLFPLEQINRLRRELPPDTATIAVEDRGDHCCHNMAYIVRPRMADWLAAHLT